MIRAGNTAKQILMDGDFAKIGKQHYRHVSGSEIKYDCNRWCWRIDGTLYSPVLWINVCEVRRRNQAAA